MVPDRPPASPSDAQEGVPAADRRALERVTVNLNAKSVDALADAARRTGDTRTDTINKALQVYSYLQELLNRGGSVLVRDGAGAKIEQLQFF